MSETEEIKFKNGRSSCSRHFVYSDTGQIVTKEIHRRKNERPNEELECSTNA
jgi:hypothetical protein